uniref:ADAM metallopeptidase with thrombospondin type 1 motif 15 n=1 Tax=Apteryx owenii TaxID=8824 RepID=A0A8B9Q6S6_APTOW
MSWRAPLPLPLLPLLLPLLLLPGPARSLPSPGSPAETAVVTPLRLDPDINGRPYFRRGPAETRRGQAVVFQLSAFGEDFYLHLAPDAHFIAPAFAAHYLGAAPAAARLRRPGLRHCFYSGAVNGDRDSFAALSLCGGLRGAFGYRGAEYVISPLASGGPDGAHLLQRRRAGAAASRCAVGSGLNPGILQALDKYRAHEPPEEARPPGKGRRAKRFVSVPRYVETLVVADESMVKFHGDDLQHYLLTLMATAARLYKHPSIRNPINIAVVKFLIIGQDDKGPKVTGNAALTLRNFCAWQKKWNKVSDKHPEYWDTAILFTKQVRLPQGLGCRLWEGVKVWTKLLS